MKILLTAAAIAIISAGPAMAYHEGKEHNTNREAAMDAKIRYYFDKADSNGDGRINKIEHDAAANDMFRNADKNRDNVLTLKEVKAAHWAEIKDMKQNLRDRKTVREAQERLDDRDDRDDRYDD